MMTTIIQCRLIGECACADSKLLNYAFSTSTTVHKYIHCLFLYFSLASFRIIPDTIIKLPHGMRPDEDERSDDEDNSTSPTSPTSGMNKFVNEYLLLRAG